MATPVRIKALEKLVPVLAAIHAKFIQDSLEFAEDQSASPGFRMEAVLQVVQTDRGPWVFPPRLPRGDRRGRERTPEPSQHTIVEFVNPI